MVKYLEVGDRGQAASMQVSARIRRSNSEKFKRINLQTSPQLDERIFMQINIEILTNKTEFAFKLT